jgi:GMP synthase (glutamine-hydrolysing)
MSKLRFLLLQSRNAGDPMAPQEVRCFARALGCDISQITVLDLLHAAPTADQLREADMLLLGGSGHYSVAVPSDDLQQPAPAWLARALDTLREIHRLARPTFASCWGFQAMARAMGGTCINDLPNAELGTIELLLTDDGRADEVFGLLPPAFAGHAGHEDHVIQLPPDAVLLASSTRVAEQAFRFADKPIYCTQFHPELDRAAMLERVVAYPEYVERIARVTHDTFATMLQETPEANTLLRQFLKIIFR